MIRFDTYEAPHEDTLCYECGAPLNIWGECPNARDHLDAEESYRDEGYGGDW